MSNDDSLVVPGPTNPPSIASVAAVGRPMRCSDNHQGLDNRLIDPQRRVGEADGEIECRERLGGVLRYYYRHAA